MTHRDRTVRFLIAMSTTGVLLALAGWLWADLKTPEIPQDLELRYMTHAFQRSDLQRQFLASMTPQQRDLDQAIGEVNKAMQADEAEMKPKCGDKHTLGYQLSGVPYCKEIEKPGTANGKSRDAQRASTESKNKN